MTGIFMNNYREYDIDKPEKLSLIFFTISDLIRFAKHIWSTELFIFLALVRGRREWAKPRMRAAWDSARPFLIIRINLKTDKVSPGSRDELWKYENEVKRYNVNKLIQGVDGFFSATNKYVNIGVSTFVYIFNIT